MSYFGSGTGWVLVQFGSLSDQLCLGRVWIRFGSGSDLGHFQVSHIRVGFDLVWVKWVRVTYMYHVRVGMGSVRVGSGLFPVVYSSLVRIGYGSSVI